VADYDRGPLNLEALQYERAIFEQRFGVPSDRLMDAFRLPDGDVLDNDDFHRWWFVHSLLQEVERSA